MWPTWRWRCSTAEPDSSYSDAAPFRCRMSPHIDPRVPFVQAAYRLLRATVKVRVEGRTDLFERAQRGEAFIFASRHGQLLPLLFGVEGLGLTIMVSRSRDGDLLASLLRPFGFSMVRGSSSAQGRLAAREALRILSDGGRLGMAVDGPRGPRGLVQDGILRLARRSSVPIVPLVASCGRSVVLHGSWDHFELPWPGSSVVIEVKGPIEVADSPAGLQEAGSRLAESLDARFPGESTLAGPKEDLAPAGPL